MAQSGWCRRSERRGWPYVRIIAGLILLLVAGCDNGIAIDTVDLVTYEKLQARVLQLESRVTAVEDVARQGLNGATSLWIYDRTQNPRFEAVAVDSAGIVARVPGHGLTRFLLVESGKSWPVAGDVYYRQSECKGQGYVPVNDVEFNIWRSIDNNASPTRWFRIDPNDDFEVFDPVSWSSGGNCMFENPTTKRNWYPVTIADIPEQTVIEGPSWIAPLPEE